WYAVDGGRERRLVGSGEHRESVRPDPGQPLTRTVEAPYLAHLAELHGLRLLAAHHGGDDDPALPRGADHRRHPSPVGGHPQLADRVRARPRPGDLVHVAGRTPCLKPLGVLPRHAPGEPERVQGWLDEPT